MADMNDEAGASDDSTVQLFGDPRSKFVERAAERRSVVDDGDITGLGGLPSLPAGRRGRDDGIATALMVLGVMVFGGTVIAGTLILINARDVGAFRNPWNSTRVAIGIAVFAIGLVQSAIVLGLARVLSHLAADRRRHA